MKYRVMQFTFTIFSKENYGKYDTSELVGVYYIILNRFKRAIVINCVIVVILILNLICKIFDCRTVITVHFYT